MKYKQSVILKNVSIKSARIAFSEISFLNKNVYQSFENMLSELSSKNWINFYIDWELSLIKELGFENKLKVNLNKDTRKSLTFNRNLLMENFIIPNRLKFPLYRNILENYFL